MSLVGDMEKAWKECIRQGGAIPEMIIIPGGVILYRRHPNQTSDDGGATFRDFNEYENQCIESFRLKIESERLTRIVAGQNWWRQ
jgi:hypothetical protein